MPPKDIPPGFTSTVFHHPVVDVEKRKQALSDQIRSSQEMLATAKDVSDAEKEKIRKAKANIANMKAALHDYRTDPALARDKLYYQFGRRVPENELDRSIGDFIVEVSNKSIYIVTVADGR